MRQVVQSDFTQVDSHWVFTYKGFILSLSPNDQGHFKLQIVGLLEPIPAATTYPSAPEWTVALDLANKFIAAYVAALENE